MEIGKLNDAEPYAYYRRAVADGRRHRVIRRFELVINLETAKGLDSKSLNSLPQKGDKVLVS